MLALFALLLVQQPSELDKAVQDAQAKKKPGLAQTQVGPATLRLIDVSLDVLFTAGTSTADEPVIQQLQGGGHDPQQRGFNVTQAELFLAGAVDPYFNAQVNIVFFITPEGETAIELEEAFAVTQTLPVQFKLGHYFTEFGRINPTHPHAWRFIDQPVVNSRFFGPDGMRAPGARAAFFLPVPWTSEVFVGLQNSRGETLVSFYGEAVDPTAPAASSQGGFFEDVNGDSIRSFADLVWTFRLENAFEPTEELNGALGLSLLYGPNDSGPGGNTLLFGADLVVKWRPTNNERGWPFVLLEAEFDYRNYGVDAAFQTGQGAPAVNDLRDWGFFAHVLWGFVPGWVAGVRFEHCSGQGQSFDNTVPDFVPRNSDPTRDDRTRVSVLLVFHPSEFSRLRLQYNFDDAASLAGTPDDSAHSVWLSVEFLIGSHPPHKY